MRRRRAGGEAWPPATARRRVRDPPPARPPSPPSPLCRAHALVGGGLAAQKLVARGIHSVVAGDGGAELPPGHWCRVQQQQQRHHPRQHRLPARGHWQADHGRAIACCRLPDRGGCRWMGVRGERQRQGDERATRDAADATCRRSRARHLHASRGHIAPQMRQVAACIMRARAGRRTAARRPRQPRAERRLAAPRAPQTAAAASLAAPRHCPPTGWRCPAPPGRRALGEGGACVCVGAGGGGGGAPRVEAAEAVGPCQHRRAPNAACRSGSLPLRSASSARCAATRASRSARRVASAWRSSCDAARGRQECV